MSKKKKWILSIFLILVVQHLSYLYVGLPKLKNELLSGAYGDIDHPGDSAYVCNYLHSMCFSGPNLNFSFNLEESPQELKKKLRVRYIRFCSDQNFEEGESIQKKFRIKYRAYGWRGDWVTLFYLYSAAQHETLYLRDSQHFYEREVGYRWCLFFWIKTFEMFHSNGPTSITQTEF